MNITALSRTLFQPLGPTPGGPPGRPSYSYVDATVGTLLLPRGGIFSAATVDPDAGTLLVPGADPAGGWGVAVDPDAGTVILAAGVDPDAGTLIVLPGPGPGGPGPWTPARAR